MMESFAEFIFLARDWKQDKTSLERGVKNLTSYPKPFWFIIFPEGTRFNVAKRDTNQQVTLHETNILFLCLPPAQRILLRLTNSFQSCYLSCLIVGQGKRQTPSYACAVAKGQGISDCD